MRSPALSPPEQDAGLAKKGNIQQIGTHRAKGHEKHICQRRPHAQAGVADIRLPDVCLGWYSTVYGLAMAEIGGLTRSATPEELTDIAGLPAERYPLTQQIASQLSHIDPAQVFRNTLGLLHEGIRVSCARQEARQQAHSAG